MYTIQKSGFLSMAGRRPYRFACSLFFLLLNIVSGASTHILFYDAAAPGLVEETIGRAASVFPVYALLSAAAFQAALTCAVLWGRGGGLRALFAYAAFCFDGFTWGFALSEILFGYGTPWAVPLLLLTLFTGMAGMSARLFLFMREDGDHRGKGRPHCGRAAPVLLLVILCQGVFAPMLLFYII